MHRGSTLPEMVKYTVIYVIKVLYEPNSPLNHISIEVQIETPSIEIFDQMRKSL